MDYLCGAGCSAKTARPCLKLCALYARAVRHESYSTGHELFSACCENPELWKLIVTKLYRSVSFIPWVDADLPAFVSKTLYKLGQPEPKA